MRHDCTRIACRAAAGSTELSAGKCRPFLVRPSRLVTRILTRVQGRCRQVRPAHGAPPDHSIVRQPRLNGPAIPAAHLERADMHRAARHRGQEPRQRIPAFAMPPSHVPVTVRTPPADVGGETAGRQHALLRQGCQPGKVVPSVEFVQPRHHVARPASHAVHPDAAAPVEVAPAGVRYRRESFREVAGREGRCWQHLCAGEAHEVAGEAFGRRAPGSPRLKWIGLQPSLRPVTRFRAPAPPGRCPPLVESADSGYVFLPSREASRPSAPQRWHRS